MHYSAATAAAAVAASTATVQNNCDFPIFLWTLSSGSKATLQGGFTPGGSWTENYGEGACEIKVAQIEDALE